MKKFFKILSIVSLFIVLIFCLSSCRKPKTYEDGYNDGYADGHFDANDELSNYSFEMYEKGYDEAYRDFAYGVIEDKAIWYARKFSEWHPEEAMCIIDCYERGDRYCGGMTITEDDYRNAIESLYRYYEYFYIACYKDDVECGYDFYD